MNNLLARWHIRIRHGDFVVLRRSDIEKSGSTEAYRHFVPFDTADWDRDPLLRRALLEMYEAVYGHRVGAPLRTEIPNILRRLHEAFRHGALVLIPSEWHIIRQGTGIGTEGAEEEEEVVEPVATPVEEELTWFRARLVDEDGSPIANEDYILVDSTGARTEGKLDGNGEVYIPPTLPHGECTISFPNIHLNPRKRQ
jgi:hypothetical protein